MSTNVTIVGNLTKDPELRYLPSGKAVCDLTVAVNERVKNPDTGEWEDGDTSFFNVSVWESHAENVSESLEKGARVVVTGRLKLRNFERQDGSKGTSGDIRADEVAPSLRWATVSVAKVKSNRSGRPDAEAAVAQVEEVLKGEVVEEF